MIKSELMRMLEKGIFPNAKQRVWTMCQVIIELLTKTVDTAEKEKLTDEQFYIAFEDLINTLSVKDHTNNDCYQSVAEYLKEFKDGK